MMCHQKILFFIACALHFSSSAAFAPLNRHHAAFTHIDSSVSSLAEEKSSPDDAPKEISYSTILKVIDEQHHIQSTTSCTYLPRETAPIDCGGSPETKPPSTYQHPATPVLSPGAVNALRLAAERYFDANGRMMGQSTASLEDILSFISPGHDAETAIKLELANSLTQNIYPLVRSAWANDKAFTFGNADTADTNAAPLLSVTSATVFASGGHSGAKVSLTTLERDAGIFVVHIDLGNEEQLSGFLDESLAKGGIYFESLVYDSDRVTDSVVGPINPGQAVVHKSDERTAAIITPSNIRELEQKDNRQTLDTLMRRQLLKTAESTRHYALRLVLTTNQSASKTTSIDSAESQIVYPEAPPAERAYRLRNFARLKDDRVRYLTLAGLIDVNDHETHLWLGFDYLSRIDNPEYKVDIEQRLSDINKAIFHLGKAAALNPTDPRVHFQLATVLGAKMECEKSTPNHIETNGRSLEQYTEIAAALGKSALCESAAVKLGISGVQDLTSCLNALAQTLCEMGDFSTAIKVIDQWAECGSVRSALAIEDMSISATEDIPSYEWLSSDATGKKVALRTVGDSPLFNDDDISLLVSAADRSFAQANGKQLSRYTMQYVGNSEVHLDDLCANDHVLKQRIDHILQNRVYPLVRQSFAEDDQGGELPAGPLCVYDSIFVRYNGDEAVLAGRVGASQPLHQDGGIYSVNVALNSHKDDDVNGFSGGGTFLEGLSRDEISCIQRPVSPGHALLHHTTARHAGAPTTSGIRDILVIFLTARHPQDISKSESTYRVERPMRLQTIAKQLPRDKLIPCLELAREHDPLNSEMSYWLGVHLLQGDSSDQSDQRWNEICRGVDVLQTATQLNPTDARAHFHLGMAIASRHKYAMRTKRAHLLPPPGEAAEALIYSFESAIRLEQVCDEAGCKNGINIPAAYLALGDFMGRLRNYPKALEYLEQVEGAIASSESEEDWAMSMLEETASISNFCRSEMQQDSSLV
ncbi:hypothetical protein ACHAXN_013276 [Cyclotella atomus]